MKWGGDILKCTEMISAKGLSNDTVAKWFSLEHLISCELVILQSEENFLRKTTKQDSK